MALDRRTKRNTVIAILIGLTLGALFSLGQCHEDDRKGAAIPLPPCYLLLPAGV